MLLTETKLNKADKENKGSKLSLKKKSKKEKETEVCFDTVDDLSSKDGDSLEKQKCW